MTMFARNLSVARYRSFDSYRLDLDEGVTVLAGPNLTDCNVCLTISHTTRSIICQREASA